MKKISLKVFKTFLFLLVFLLGACSGIQLFKSTYEVKTNDGVLRCEYERGVYFNCHKIESEVSNEKTQNELSLDEKES